MILKKITPINKNKIRFVILSILLFVILPVLLLINFPLSAHASGVTNMLQNPLFENSGSNWLNPWAFYATNGTIATIRQNTATTHNSNDSAVVTITKGNTTYPYYVQLIQAPIKVNAGQVYTASFWAKGTVAGPVQFVLQQNHSPWTVYNLTPLHLTTSWAQYAITFTEPTTDTSTQYVINMGGLTGTVYLDAMSLIAGATPTAKPTLVPTAAPTVMPILSTICLQQFQTSQLDKGTYMLQSNEWDSSSPFKVCSDGNRDFKVTTDNINNATNQAPGAYPSIFRGNHWGTITQNSGLPVAVSQLVKGGVVTSTVNTTTTPNGAWDDSYDTWFEPTATDNQTASGTVEMMIWLSHTTSVNPAGSLVASNVSIAGNSYNVYWSGSVFTFEAVNSGTAATIDFGPFAAYGISKGYISPSMYFIDIEHGFEVWNGGTGLQDNSFQVCTPTGC